MANMILATPVISDAAYMVTSTTAASLSKENLKTKAVGEVCRFLSPQDAFIVVGEINEPIDFIALIGHNGSGKGIARVRASNFPDVMSQVYYDSGDLPLRSNQSDFMGEEPGELDRNNFIFVLPELMNFKYWRIDILDEEIPYLDVGRLYLSQKWQPATNMDYGYRDGHIDPSVLNRTISGRQNSLERPKYRFAELTLSFLSEQEAYDHVFEIERARGTTKDILFVYDYENLPYLQKKTIYGTMRELPGISHPYFELYEKSYRIEEIIE